MKKITILALSLLAIKGYSNCNNSNLKAVPTYTSVVRNNGGLFGYKYINSTSTSNGSGGTNDVLDCSNPGFTRCAWKNAAEMTTGTLTIDELDKIDSMVNEKLEANRESMPKGNFVFNNDYLVVYEYNVDINKLEYKILTREEAKENGFEM